LLPAVDFLAAKEALLEMSVRYFSLMFLVALKLSFPILASLLVIVVLLGLLGKAAPQMNIMILGLPIQYGMGLLALFLVLPHLIQMFGVLFENGVNDVMMLLMKLRAPA
ncbi:MAG: flagellar biosynthetic protein FliR, partial [Spirochaetia bacterium]|nr:flagellar biosynthetic protein FliR [Spirochaetia bacterium]